MKGHIYSAAIISLATSVAGAPADSASVCCDPLSQSLPDILFTSTSPSYDTLINARWSGTSVLHPGCVLTPKSSADVATALKILVDNQCTFAVKAGGHNANTGANSIDGGVSIDLSTLNTATLADDRSFVSLGAGVTWGQAYDAFNDSNIGFPGGICEDVGVGGVSLGGGQSLFQPKKGWAIDNILNYELVLASGEVVNANQTDNADLFKALKGGNTNFGIVTRVEIAAFDFDGLWGGEVYTSLTGNETSRSDTLDKLSHAMTDFTANNHLDTSTAVQLMTVYLAEQKGQLVLSAFGNTDGTENPPSVKEFMELPNQVSAAVGPVKLADFVHKVSEFQAKGYREVTASVTFTNGFETLREIWDATDAVYNGLPQKDQVDWMISFIPQPKVQQSYAAARGGNSLGLSDIEDDQIVLWLTSRWTDPALDGMMEDARRQFVDDVEAVAKKNNAYHPFLYVNYAAPFQDPLCGYGAESAAFLKETAGKYDPNGVFQTLMPGGFKVKDMTCV